MPRLYDRGGASNTTPARLVRHVAHVNRLHKEREADPELAAALERIAAWQARRLRRTYADLHAQPRYAQAIRFFETDLYGGGDFARRDADLARIVPIMVRTLPDAVIGTIGEAMELNALTQELDRALNKELRPAGARFSVADYCAAYRRAKGRAARERQVALIADIGRALDRFVKKPLVRAALATMRHPARIAGMAALHDFLERGFSAFEHMGGARAFVATIVDRETALMEAIFAGDDAPFPDPTSDADRPAAAR